MTPRQHVHETDRDVLIEIRTTVELLTTEVAALRSDMREVQKRFEEFSVFRQSTSAAIARHEADLVDLQRQVTANRTAMLEYERTARTEHERMLEQGRVDARKIARAEINDKKLQDGQAVLLVFASIIGTAIVTIAVQYLLFALGILS